MEKQKRWQLFLIVAVIILTVYNILPTIFYYAKPLDKPINEQRANAITLSIAERVNGLEKESVEWLSSFCGHLGLKPLGIKLDPARPEYVALSFKNAADANKFKTYLPRAGALIPFVPAQLSLYGSDQDHDKQVLVQRKIPLHFDPNQINAYYQFSPKVSDTGQLTDLYRALVSDRALQLGITLGGPSENALYLKAAIDNPTDPQTQDLIFFLSQNVASFIKAFGENSPIAHRYFASFTQIDIADRAGAVQDFINVVQNVKDKIGAERTALQQEKDRLQSQGLFLETVRKQRLDQLTSREKTLSQAIGVFNKNSKLFAAGKSPWTYATFGTALQESAQKVSNNSKLQSISLKDKNPYIDQLVIDWGNEKIYLQPHPDLIAYKQRVETNNYLKDLVDQMVYDQIASASRGSSETILPYQDQFEVSLSSLQGSKSFLAMRLSKIAEAKVSDIKETILSNWNPIHPDLSRDAFPIWDYETYISLPIEQQQLGLVVYAPSQYSKMPPQGFRMNSIYVIAKGVDKILQKMKASPESPQNNQFFKDFNQLREIFVQNGFFGYSGASYSLSSDYANDFIFEAEDFYQTVIKATREDFTVHGTKRYAVLEFTDVEQRILTENKIDTSIHEDLLKWRDDYQAAQLKIKGTSPYDVPPTTKNAYWDNFKLSCVKFFRGDDRKILHWGLDLSGGKTVQIELRDNNNRVVTNEADIKQGIDELYKRVNKMGVSEVSIRQEGNSISLDFPGSQGLSAADLVKASSMYFHVVNEKFSPSNTLLSEHVNRFLQEIWNEAVVTNRKEVDEINQIALKHLYGDSLDPEQVQPRSEAAKALYDSGLRLANVQETIVNASYNDAISKIAVFRGNDFTDWQGQTNPLIIVFNNYALEGSNLDNIRASYDPTKGNFLAFGVKSSQTSSDKQKISPRDDLFAWTSQFSKEKIAGTVNETYSRGNGWRMAVILNGSIISAPTLDSPLKDSAMITGSFTQREMNQLEADLKAGSLSFTPYILSEKNVSPELGGHERTLGIVAMAISLLLIIVVMVGYYRFGGVVASIAVIINLLIMWATLQNIGATLTLANIAGLILSVGMAVDANVLVFERIREEFAATGRIATAVHSGYRKAFSAIIDSNVTTVIAALILLHFDSGPIKGFAVTLIIGIMSSMFTALFMTRYFFAGWVQNPHNKQLTMMNLFKAKKFDFLKFTKITMIVSSVIILVGGFFLVKERHTILGMDFTGGYALNIELQEQPNVNYRLQVEQALMAQGASAQDFQIRELTPSNNIRLFLSAGMQQPGHPFYGMPLQSEDKVLNYPYESNPKINWIVTALHEAHVPIAQQSLEQLDKSWTEVSGQMSDTMRNAAVIGLIIALISILIYITTRFEFKYAISATICLAHDIIFTIAIIGILYYFGVPVQIDLHTVAALMTIVGYSLNDTIIVFDRIREDVRHMRKSSFSDIINHALNVTLSRTLMTSGTTLLVLIPLIVLGGSTIFSFALVMAIGVIFGTLSSLFIAAPLMLYFHQRENQNGHNHQKLALNEQ